MKRIKDEASKWKSTFIRLEYAYFIQHQFTYTLMYAQLQVLILLGDDKNDNNHNETMTVTAW